ncbi:DUF1799 domain-containing protein [Methylomagnum ishizawai]|uniref:DUF1799 domain-containing protein n=1 Tax=Methylomagnum ishizawai TaxID=1760988 RepID=UPI001C324ECC|nr:DUF1799 domain-containing protein [Methylomagnum ishizawai]BBL75574.1 hypothetical protein MishRS11D_26720 [Methylomagnum ishizawai]
MNLPPAALAAMLGNTLQAASPDFQVLPENWDTVMAFIECRHDWRRELPAFGTEWIWHGLDKPACECIIRNLGHKEDKAREIFQGILIMQEAALPLLNKGKKSNGR